MNSDARYHLRCPDCDWQLPCGPTEMLIRLQSLGLMRRQAEPGREELLELLRHHVSRLSCDACRQTGLRLETVPDDDDWGEPRRCEVCERPIPAERLEILPRTRRCAACQGAPTAQPDQDYCPRCGGVLQVRVRSGRGTTRYVAVCPDCGHAAR